MIYDCFMFFNENDLLEVRINQHWSFADKFIIIEARETHTGLPKPLNFDKKRFSKYSEKIIYKTIDSFEEEMKKNPHLCSKIFEKNIQSQPHLAKDDWMRDNFQNEYLTKILFELNPHDDDLVLFSCLDEILKPEKVTEAKAVFDQKKKFSLRSNILQQTNLAENIDPVFNFWTSLYAYKLNLYSKITCVGLITTIRNLRYLKHTDLRNFWCLTHDPIENSGWHFTFLDNTNGQKVLAKYKSWAHSRDGNKSSIYFDIKTPEEAVERVIAEYNLKKIDLEKEEMPKWLMENLDKYSDYIYK